ncbi:DUF4427 domain-containing protein [Variovorax sp. H27-G14]|uniref:DUF4427 domain-containing protein n=1 Tax=Variovorax sp. H27-G14 TaxID=3111914 RepID=UPI0038FCA4A5
MDNNYRFDLSDYLLHFFRDIDQSGPNGISLPEHLGWHSTYEDEKLPAIFMLRAALRNGRLWATWSYRNGVRTIYGPDPAVCFSEMPLAAFVEASRRRSARGEAMGEVALIFPKNNMRSLGARTAIYGLSQPNATVSSGTDGGARIFSPYVLPHVEQYRYVADVVAPGRMVDWTHEREWRWAMRGAELTHRDEGGAAEWDQVPGLELYQPGLSGIGAVVKTREHAELVIRDMLALIDAHVAQETAFRFVLVTDDLTSPRDIQDKQQLNETLQAASIDLTPYFLGSKLEAQTISARFGELVARVNREAGPAEDGELGGCWLWLHDGAEPFVRALLKTNRAFVTKDGRYLAQLFEFSDSRSLAQREEMTDILADHVEQEFGTKSCRFSVLHSNNPETEPFYASPHDLSIPFYNWASRYK